MINNNLEKNRSAFFNYPVLVISLCAGFLFYKYILQIYPSIITDQLMREFKLDGEGLGNLAATFYYSYVFAQLLVGVALDKYSTRWLTAIAIFSCALGLYLFSDAQALLMAQLSRALMGIGVAFATIAYMKLAASWFPPRQYALVGGLLATAAMAGAIFGQAPLALAVNSIGWRQCLFLISLAGFGLAILFALIVRDAPSSSHTLEKSSLSLKDLYQVIRSKQNWLLTFYSGLAFSPIAIFGGLWGNPFMQEAYHISKTQAASMISLVFIGLGIGSPVLGALSDRLGNRRTVMFFGTFAAFIAIFLVVYFPAHSLQWTSVLLFIFGFGIGAFMLAFAIGKELNSAALTATVIAMINTSDAVLDAITEPGIGKLLDMRWDGTIVNGVHYFSLASYQFALGVLPIYLAVATLLLIWVKNK